MIGFSDKVDLGGVGKLRSDPTIAMRIEYPDLPAEPPPRLALYLRGTAFDQYNGRSWSRSVTERRPADFHPPSGIVRITRRADLVRDKRLVIDLEPIDPPVVFLPPDAVAMRMLSRGTPLLGGAPTVISGPEGEFKYLSVDDRGLRYEVFLAGPNERPPPDLGEARRRYLAVPPDLPPRIAELARSWVGKETDPARMAKLVETRLRRDYRYDLESPSGAADNPLDHFLFESKRGHCEFYSTAMAVMLRTLGVPTRNVTGFIGGSFNRFGRYYAVRQGDAHSWIEVWIDKKGWTRFDPTPPSDAAPQSDITGFLAFVRDFVEAAAQRWNRHVVGYDLKQQVHLFRSVQKRYSEMRDGSEIMGGALASPGRIALAVAGFLLLGIGLWWLRRQRAQESDEKPKKAAQDPNLTHAVALYRQLDAAMAVRGIGRSPSTPPLAHARALSELGHPAGDEVLALTRLYVEARFGGRSLDEEARRDFARRVKALRQVRDEVARAA
jgi:transglutaminase-like putative cysteine protease